MTPVVVGQSYRTEYVSMVPAPLAFRVTGTFGSAAMSCCNSLLRSAAHSPGSVEYTPTEYLLITPPLAPTRPNEPGLSRIAATVSAMPCSE